MKIENNYLNQEEFTELKKFLINPLFPVFLTIDNKSNLDDDLFCFQHVFYDNGNYSPYFKNLEFFLNKLNVKELLRFRAVYYPINQQIQKSSFHTDFDKEHQTSIFYLDTNNGYTEFENNEIVKSISNSLVTFNGLKKHRAVTQNDTKLRTILNINYK